MQKQDLRIVFMGTPDFAVNILDAICKANYNVVAVVSTPDKAAGRGKKLRSCAVKQYADKHQIPTLCPLRFKDETFLAQLASFKADIQIVVAFKMLPKVVWDMPPLGTFNLHASLLPQYRGAAPINHAIINGESTTGVSTFFLDEQIDTGKIILQKECSINVNDNAGSLHDKLMALGATAVLETLELLLRDRVHSIAQSSMSQTTELKDAPKIFKEDCLLNWNQTPEQLHNKIRGLSPYPAAFTHLLIPNKKTLSVKIFEVEIAENHPYGSDSPGNLRCDGKSYLFVFTKDNKGLYIKHLQLEGKKAMPITDFLRGFQWNEHICFANQN